MYNESRFIYLHFSPGSWSDPTGTPFLACLPVGIAVPATPISNWSYGRKILKLNRRKSSLWHQTIMCVHKNSQPLLHTLCIQYCHALILVSQHGLQQPFPKGLLEPRSDHLHLSCPFYLFYLIMFNVGWVYLTIYKERNGGVKELWDSCLNDQQKWNFPGRLLSFRDYRDEMEHV